MTPEQYAARLRARVGGTEMAFPREEYDARVAAVRGAMAKAGLDAVLVTHRPDLCWLTGYTTFGVGNHACLVLPASGAPVLQTTAMEVPAATVCTWVEDVRVAPWVGQAGAGTDLARIVDSMGLGRGHLGLQGRLTGLLPFIEAQLREGLPNVRLTDGSEIVARLRLIKSPREIECLKSAARYTEAGIVAAYAAMHDGVTDNEIARAGGAAMIGAGSEFMSVQTIVTSGVRTGYSHQNHRRIAIKAGDPIFLEFGGCHLRYTSALMRTAVIGKPPAEFARAADAVLATLETVIAEARPGVTGRQIVERAKKAHAHLSDDLYLPGAYGYHVGVGFPPTWADGIGFIAAGNEEPLAENMVFHMPLAFRNPGKFGVGISETIVITKNGNVPFNTHPRTLHVV